MSRSRRSFLKGLAVGAGGLGLAPLLNQLDIHASGDQRALPKRFVFVIKSSGLSPTAVRPNGVNIGDGSRTIDLNLRHYRLPENLQALDPFKDQMMILEGLSGANFAGNHSSYYGAMSCHNAPDKPVAPTIDCMLGNRMTAPFSNYAFAPNGHVIGSNFGPTVADTAVYPRLSAYGENRPMAYQASAEKAYRQLFGSALDLRSGGEREFDLQTNLLDFLAEDTRRLSRQVNQEEREKLDSYLNAFDTVRTRNDRLREMRATIRQHAPRLSDQYTSIAFADRIGAFFEMASAALKIGLTNVISIRMDWLSVKYENLGFRTVSVHDIGHGMTTDNGIPAARATDMIIRFQVEQISRLAASLRAVREGNGTMLDNTMILYFSDTGEAHHSNRHEWPFVVVGGGRNLRLRTAGRYLRYANYGRNGHRTLGNWYNSILQATGFRRQDYFGQVDPNLRDLNLRGPLAELMV